MVLPAEYANHYMPVKYFLASYRALSDGRRGVDQLDELLNKATTLLSEWRVIWIGTCAILRTAIDLFQVDMRSCIAPRIREEISTEWKAIKDRKDDHPIFWQFLRSERDNVVHEYEWRAYEAWIKPDGTFRAESLSLLVIDNDDARPYLLMRGGPFEGRDSLDLLREGADWVEARILHAIRRAGFDPDEDRSLAHFQRRPPGLLGGAP